MSSSFNFKDSTWYRSFMGLSPKRIAHWEHWSCPDAESYITGIDYYEHPKLCRERMREIYPFLDYESNFRIPETDEPKPLPKLDSTGEGMSVDEDGKRRVRWGEAETVDWDFGRAFTSTEQVFAYSPVQHLSEVLELGMVHGVGCHWDADMTDGSSVEDALFRKLRSLYPAEWGEKGPDGSASMTCWYTTMFMWPLLTFGWDLFLQTCLDERFERIMDEFAEVNRMVFRAFAKLPINFVLCHDDIVNTRGPVCSPSWMHKYIFPRYEELWSILKSAGKEVLFMSDGNIDAFVDDVMACGARGIISEPYADYKSIARRFENCFLAGEGDNRVLSRNNPAEIRAMVASMVETAKMCGGYMMCVGNHIPWNVPPEAVKCYLDLSADLSYR